ncbi:MAG TPA: YCF48-related protein [Opitutaceae bacterium]|nr:YCF48-related protein [Opitutaceae bacterium]
MGHHVRAMLFTLAGALVLMRAAGAAETAPRMLLLDAAVIGTEIIAVGERGAILRSADSGKTWQATPPVTAAALTGVSFAADGKQGWAVGHDALILGTTDAGRTWRKQWQGDNLADSFLDVLALDANRAIAVGAFNLCLVTEDGGKTWTRRPVLDSDYHLNRLSRGPTGTLYLAGEHGTLLRSENRGATWIPIASPYDGSFYGILPLDAHTLLAYGLRGRFYRSADNGRSWQIVPNERRVLIATAVKLKRGTIVAAGQARTLFESPDEAKTVASGPSGQATAIAELLEAPNGSLLGFGEAGVSTIETGRTSPELFLPENPPTPGAAAP